MMDSLSTLSKTPGNKTKVTLNSHNPTVACTSTSPSEEGSLWLVWVQPCPLSPHCVAGSGVSVTLVRTYAQALYLPPDVWTTWIAAFALSQGRLLGDSWKCELSFHAAAAPCVCPVSMWLRRVGRTACARWLASVGARQQGAADIRALAWRTRNGPRMSEFVFHL